jgi:uncharacterized membrane protein YfcA
VLVALAAGLLLGLALGTVGGGGAVLAVPVLIYLLGQSVHAATAESLLVVVGAAGAGAAGHARHGTVCWKLAGAFAAAAVPGSVLGTVANRAASAEPLLGAFAILLLGVAVMTWRRATRDARVGVGDESCPPVRLPVVAGLGMSVGLLTGLFGVGGGFAVVPALAIGLRVPVRRAIATSLVVVTVISAVGFAEHLLAGSHVAWATTLPFATAAILTASSGAAVGARLPRRALARGFALLLGAVAIYLLVSVVATGGPPHG